MFFTRGEDGLFIYASLIGACRGKKYQGCGEEDDFKACNFNKRW